MTARANAFAYSLDFVLGREGGLANSKRDRGGLTNYGVTQKTYDYFRVEVWKQHPQTVRLITEAEVRRIYLSYWNEGACPALDAIDYDDLAVCVHDCAINQGAGTARLLLQRAAGVVEDGIVGKATLAALRALGEREALRRFLLARAANYGRIIRNDPQRDNPELAQRGNWPSWSSRLRHCARTFGVEIAPTYAKGCEPSPSLSFASPSTRSTRAA